MKQADRAGARVTVILEEGAMPKLRDMETGEQREVGLDTIIDEIKASL
jgi:histidyl-tRNA synthetase